MIKQNGPYNNWLIIQVKSAHCHYKLIIFVNLGISYDNMQQILEVLLKTRLVEADVNELQLQGDTEISLYLGYKKYVQIQLIN